MALPCIESFLTPHLGRQARAELGLAGGRARLRRGLAESDMHLLVAELMNSASRAYSLAAHIP